MRRHRPRRRRPLSRRRGSQRRRRGATTIAGRSSGGWIRARACRKRRASHGRTGVGRNCARSRRRCLRSRRPPQRHRVQSRRDPNLARNGLRTSSAGKYHVQARPPRPRLRRSRRNLAASRLRADPSRVKRHGSKRSVGRRHGGWRRRSKRQRGRSRARSRAGPSRVRSPDATCSGWNRHGRWRRRRRRSKRQRGSSGARSRADPSRVRSLAATCSGWSRHGRWLRRRSPSLSKRSRESSRDGNRSAWSLREPSRPCHRRRSLGPSRVSGRRRPPYAPRRSPLYRQRCRRRSHSSSQRRAATGIVGRDRSSGAAKDAPPGKTPTAARLVASIQCARHFAVPRGRP
jgi:hypothetical protein